MKTREFKKVSPNETTSDPEYQREIDIKRCIAMADKFDESLVGVVVLSRRPDGSLVRIDGQHRFETAIRAGFGDHKFLAEIHSGLTVQEEASLFLRLNGGRSSVKAFDKFRARVTSEEPNACAILAISKRVGLSVSKTWNKNSVSAVEALDHVYRSGNLDATLRVLKSWGSGDPKAFDGRLLKAVSSFLMHYKEANAFELGTKLAGHMPDFVCARIGSTKKTLECSEAIAACVVLREVYNKRRKKDALPPMDLQKRTKDASLVRKNA